jgi:ABC-type multidrug transport system fused ATPase/permease subunit
VISISPTPNNALCFKNFSFIYGNDKNNRPAISDVSFDLKEGEILILAGPKITDRRFQMLVLILKKEKS